MTAFFFCSNSYFNSSWGKVLASWLNTQCVSEFWLAGVEWSPINKWEPTKLFLHWRSHCYTSLAALLCSEPLVLERLCFYVCDNWGQAVVTLADLVLLPKGGEIIFHHHTWVIVSWNLHLTLIWTFEVELRSCALMFIPPPSDLTTRCISHECKIEVALCLGELPT